MSLEHTPDYHQGYEDGYAAALAAREPAPPDSDVARLLAAIRSLFQLVADGCDDPLARIAPEDRDLLWSTWPRTPEGDVGPSPHP